MKRSARIREIRQKLQNRKLYWFGNRVADGLALTDLPELASVAGLTCPVPSTELPSGGCLERELGHRVDLNTYNLDDDHRPEVETLRRQMHRLMREPNVTACYRPSAFLSSLVFSNIGSCQLWGLPHLKQRAFEYKPWIESELQALQVRTIPWLHYSTLDWPNIFQDFEESELVVREATGSGGAAIALARSKEDVRRICEDVTDGVVSVSALMREASPISVNAVVYRNGDIFLSVPSLQLIGLPESTRRYFGFCGNDFGFARSLPGRTLDNLEDVVRRIARWLSSSGYLGAFGVDFLVWDGDLYFTEINPRFMASGPLAAKISRQLDETDIYLEHLAAFANLPPVPGPSLQERVSLPYDQLSQVIVYNKSRHHIGRAHVECPSGSDFVIVEEAPIGLSIAPEAQLFKLVFNKVVGTSDGKLDSTARTLVETVIRQFVAGGRTPGDGNAHD